VGLNGKITGVCKGLLESLGLTIAGVAVGGDTGRVSVVTSPAGVSVPDITNTAITWTVEVTDGLGGVDIVGAPTKAFTCQVAGTYMAVVSCSLANTGGTSEWGLYVNHYNSSDVSQSSTVQFGALLASGNSTWTTTWIGTMVAGDYLQGRIYHTTGSARDRNAGRMTITRLR
jgi:hypothetical protein